MVFYLLIRSISGYFFGMMQENIDHRIEINKLYEQWLITKHSVITYLTSDKKHELRKNINTNIRVFEKSFSLLDSSDGDTDIHRLVSRWIAIKEQIVDISISDNSYDEFEKQIYWINNSTHDFDHDLRVIMDETDNFYNHQLRSLWGVFCIIALLFIAVAAIFILYIHKLMKSMKTEKEYNALFSDMIKSREREKQNMVLEIHDTVIQDMTFSKMLCMDLINSPEQQNEKLKMLTTRIVSALQQIRDISYDIRPPEMAKNLRQIITLYVENWKIKTGKKAECRFAGIDNLKVTDTFKLNIFRIIQELLANIAKHSDATEVKIIFIASYPSILVKVIDNSSGYDLTMAMFKSDGKAHSGLRGITERVKISKGEINIKSQTGNGVAVTMSFPIDVNVEL